MLMLSNLPLYFQCFFFDKKDRKVVFTYKIEQTGNQDYPFQLLKRIADGPMGWMNLSVYASVNDSVVSLLEELFTAELSDEVYQRKAAIASAAILKKLDSGDRTVAIYDDSGKQVFRLEYDVDVEGLVQRNARLRMQKRPRRTAVHID